MVISIITVWLKCGGNVQKVQINFDKLKTDKQNFILMGLVKNTFCFQKHQINNTNMNHGTMWPLR